MRLVSGYERCHQSDERVRPEHNDENQTAGMESGVKSIRDGLPA